MEYYTLRKLPNKDDINLTVNLFEYLTEEKNNYLSQLPYDILNQIFINTIQPGFIVFDGNDYFKVHFSFSKINVVSATMWEYSIDSNVISNNGWIYFSRYRGNTLLDYAYALKIKGYKGLQINYHMSENIVLYYDLCHSDNTKYKVKNIKNIYV